MKTIDVNVLDKTSLDNAIKEVNKFQKEFERKTVLVVNRLLDRALEIAQEEVPIDDGDLYESLKIERRGLSGRMYTDCDHASFVEFGTGLEGANTYNGNATPYQYYVPSDFKAVTSDGRYGWYTKINGKTFFVVGQFSNPFMFRTFRRLVNEVIPIAKEIFG